MWVSIICWRLEHRMSESTTMPSSIHSERMAILMALNCSSGMKEIYTEQLDVLDFTIHKVFYFPPWVWLDWWKSTNCLFKPRMPPRKLMRVICALYTRWWTDLVRDNYYDHMSKAYAWINMQHELWSKLLTYVISGINVNPCFQCIRDPLQWPVLCSFNNIHLLQAKKGMHYTSHVHCSIWIHSHVMDQKCGLISMRRCICAFVQWISCEFCPLWPKILVPVALILYKPDLLKAATCLQWSNILIPWVTTRNRFHCTWKMHVGPASTVCAEYAVSRKWVVITPFTEEYFSSGLWPLAGNMR